MVNNQKKDFFFTFFIAVLGLVAIYCSSVFLKYLPILFLSGTIVLTTLPIQIRKKKQRKLIADNLDKIDIALQKNIYEATQVTLEQLKYYAVLGTGISLAKLYKIEEMLLNM